MDSTGTIAKRPKAKAISSTEKCCSCGCEERKSACCDLTCFERPDYHCGHLLTDADLSLQMRYVVQKIKMRNRTLHGHGVVCGLKLTCDPDCCGHILVHEGYAIDPCGNDIVVCETVCFDVIEALRAKGLLAKAEQRDPCKPGLDERECNVPQCFYVTISYREEDADFETPFQAGCASGPQDCLPTRIRERFRLDVTDELPKNATYLDRLEEKLKHCYRLFTDSPVGRLIRKEMDLLRIVADGKAKWAVEGPDRNCQIFCLLKAQFQQYLKQHPDQLSCNLAKDVACLVCPEERGDKYAPAMQDAFAKLLKLMHRYQYDCVLEDLVFCCEAPKEGGVVVLGCVEVDDCCVLRVSNTHRSYVWSFANIIPILATSALTGKMHKASPEEVANDERTEPSRASCCDDFVDFDHRTFLDEFEANMAGRYLATTAPLRAMRALHQSFGDSFAFADSTAFSPTLLANMSMTEARRHAETLGLPTTTANAEAELRTYNPLQAFLSQSLIRRNDALRLYPGAQDALRALTPDFVGDVSPEVGLPTIEALSKALSDRDETIAGLRKSMTELEARVARLEPRSRRNPPS